MADKRQNRGADPRDEDFFGPGNEDVLRAAMDDYCWLLSRGYAQSSSLKIVGDHFSLHGRQRLAIMRGGCSIQQALARKKKQFTLDQCRDRAVAIDGYNTIITIEAALAGAFIFSGRDGCYRDLAGLHGSYRIVAQTEPAAKLIGNYLREYGAGPVTWYIDRPISNSGRLKVLLTHISDENGWGWNFVVANNPDKTLVVTDEIVATSDSVILDARGSWINLARLIIKAHIPDARVIDMGFFSSTEPR